MLEKERHRVPNSKHDRQIRGEYADSTIDMGSHRHFPGGLEVLTSTKDDEKNDVGKKTFRLWLLWVFPSLHGWKVEVR
jgi:hypothetical protein